MVVRFYVSLISSPSLRFLPFRTSTATMRAQCSLPDLNSRTSKIIRSQCPLPGLNREAKDLPDRTPERSHNMPENCQKECQTICQEGCQKGCQNICQKECQKECQKGRQKEWRYAKMLLFPSPQTPVRRVIFTCSWTCSAQLYMNCCKRV